MKLLSTFVKEMKIALRGFYFYMEILVAVLLLIVLFTLVSENQTINTKEYIYLNIPIEKVFEYISKENKDGGGNFFSEIDIRIKQLEDTEFTLKPNEFTIVNQKNGIEKKYSYEDEKKINLKTFEKYNPKTNQSYGYIYLFSNEEDMIRLSHDKGNLGIKLSLDENENLNFEYYLQGFEPKKFSDVLYILHTSSNKKFENLEKDDNIRIIGTTLSLNNRELLIPPFVTILGSLMGFFIIISYIFLDKDQGVIKAFAVSPSSINTYLLTKTFVSIISTMLSTSIIVIPVMKFKPDYLLFYALLFASSFTFACLGLIVASFFNNLSNAFSILYLIMLVLVIPVISYYISSFDPLWIRYLPTYPLLQGFKSIISGNSDVGYILSLIGFYLITGSVLLKLSSIRFKKTLSI